MKEQAIQKNDAGATLYYDGECPFCRACVRFIERFDHHHRITSVPLQNSAHATKNACYETIIFISNNKQSQYSRTIVDVLLTLGGAWWWLGWLLWLVPRPLRDFGYRFVGRHRNWFVSSK